MKKIFSFFILFILVNLAAIAQQEPLYSNYMLLRSVTNPGFTGADKTINAIFTNRTMFAGFGNGKSIASDGKTVVSSGKPVTSVFGVEAPVEIFGLRSGLGLVIINDEIGFNTNVNVDFTYAYHHQMEYGTFGFGLTMGFNSYQIEPEWYTPTGDYWTSPGSDNLIPEQFKDLTFGLGLGAYFETTKYYLGFSTSKINSPSLIEPKGSIEKTVGFFAPNYYLTGAYNIELPDPLFDMRPSFVLRSDLAAFSLDMNGTIYYKNKYWAGLGLRVTPLNISSINLLGGTELANGLRLGYAMDINTSYMLSAGAATSHEVIVTYSFNLDTKRDQKYKSIRYL
jgi:type IX secretion system PorP/SprF family membrane protein